jgi:hypothetical protein
MNVVLPNVVARLDEFINLDRHGGFFPSKSVGYGFHISVHMGVGRQLLYTKIIKLFCIVRHCRNKLKCLPFRLRYYIHNTLFSL